MGHTATKELLVARWTELINDPSLHDLPYKIELNQEGTTLNDPRLRAKPRKFRGDVGIE
jgi:hypothetical protein